MEKTKLGLSIALFSALIYVCGLAGIFTMLALSVYIFYFEDSKVLKTHSIRALLFLSVMMILSALIGSSGRIISVIDTLLAINLYPSKLIGLLQNILAIVQDVGLVYMAYNAFTGKKIEIKILDKYYSGE